MDEIKPKLYSWYLMGETYETRGPHVVRIQHLDSGFCESHNDQGAVGHAYMTFKKDNPEAIVCSIMVDVAPRLENG